MSSANKEQKHPNTPKRLNMFYFEQSIDEKIVLLLLENVTIKQYQFSVEVDKD
jgi:hypothetical protein